MYKYILLYDTDCMQCKYVLAKFKHSNIEDKIQFYVKDSKEFNAYKTLYKIQKVPIIFIFKDKELLYNKILDKKDDIDWCIDFIYIHS